MLNKHPALKYFYPITPNSPFNAIEHLEGLAVKDKRHQVGLKVPVIEGNPHRIAAQTLKVSDIRFLNLGMKQSVEEKIRLLSPAVTAETFPQLLFNPGSAQHEVFQHHPIAKVVASEQDRTAIVVNNPVSLGLQHRFHPFHQNGFKGSYPP